MLLDVRNGLILDEGLILARLDHLERLIDAVDPREIDAHAQLHRLRETLSSIPDESSEHKQAQERLDAFIDSHSAVVRVSIKKWLFDQLLTLDLPDNARSELTGRTKKFTKAVEVLSRSASEEEGRLDLDRSPFFKLLRSASALPILSEADKGGLAKMFVTCLSLLNHFAPKLRQRLSDAAANGGWSGVGDMVKEFVVSLDGADDDATIPQGSHRSWTKTQWRELVAQFPTCTEASRRVGISEKTIRTYLQRHNIKAPWGKQKT
jgi:hypothetical protein